MASPILSWLSLANCVMALPKNLKLLAALGMSTAFAKLIGLPLSLLSASAKRFRLASSNSDIFIKILLRSSILV